jgi:hypothetical protein
MVTSEEPQVWELYVHISFCELLAWQQCYEHAEVWIQLRRSHHTLMHYHNPFGTLQESILKFASVHRYIGSNLFYVPNLMKTGFGNCRGMLLHTEGLVEKNTPRFRTQDDSLSIVNRYGKYRRK